MFEVLDLYEQPYDPRHPKVCFDEKNEKLHAEERKPLPMKPGQPTRRDYEYKCNGIRNLFIFIEPQAGFRHVLITRRRTQLDFAYAMCYLASGSPDFRQRKSRTNLLQKSVIFSKLRY